MSGQLEEKLDQILEDLDKLKNDNDLIKKALKIVPDKEIMITNFKESVRTYEEFAIDELSLEQVTINNHKSAVLGFLNHSKGEINENTIKSYLDSNKSSSWRSNQLKALRKYIRDFLKLGRWIEEFKLPKEKVKAKKTVLPTNDQLADFCCYFQSSQLQIIFLLLLNSGTRIGEILSLKYSDIDFDQNMIDASNMHKGETKFSWFSFFTKQTAEILDSYIYSNEFQFEEGSEDNTKLFTISSRTVQKSFKDISEFMDVSLHPHLMRTIFAERCREAGIKEEYIDAFCGRTPQSTLQKHYTDYSPEALRKQYDKVESFLTLRFSQEQ